MDLHLKIGSCIQTTAQKRHENFVKSLLESNVEPDSELESQLELLSEFLSKTDFSRLRSEKPELNGSQNLSVRISRDEKIGFEIQIIEDQS